MKAIHAFLIITATAVSLFTSVFVFRQLDIDSCLDAGGRWNYDSSTCESASTEHVSLKQRGIMPILGAAGIGFVAGAIIFIVIYGIVKKWQVAS
jgi:hypothetical protein